MGSRLQVSVIISTYNRASLLPEAIDSLLKQSRVPDEIIVVDDGSTDNTSEVLAQYSHPVILISQENQGLARGRNRGICKATGDLIAFLDSDDFLASNSIEKRAQILEDDDSVDVVYSNIIMTDAQGHPIGLYTEIRPGVRPSGKIFVHFAKYNLMPVHAYMLRRSCFETTGLYSDDVPGLEDYDLWLRMAAHFEFSYIDEPLGYYRTHDTMMTVEHQEQMQRDELKVHTRIFAMDAFKVLSGKEKAAIYVAHGKRHGRSGKMKEARRWFWKAIRTSPLAKRPYAFWVLTLLGRIGFLTTLSLYGRLRGDRDFFARLN